MSIKFNPITSKFDLVANIKNGTAQGQIAFWDATLNKWVPVETSEIFWDDTNKRVEPQNLRVTGVFENYNADTPDMGLEQDSDLRGLHKDYIAEKILAYCKIGGSANEEEGSIRNNAGTFQIYLNGAWEDVVTNFRFREDSTEGYELEHRPVGFDWWYEVASGNSDKKGLNGLPLIQNYSASMGAYPVPLQLDGGTFN